MTNAGSAGSTPEFDDFMNDGAVEVGSELAAAKNGEAVEEKPKARAPKKEAAPVEDPDAVDDGGDDSDPEDDGEDQEDPNAADEDDDQDEKPKKKRKPSDRIRELTRQLRDKDRQMETILDRLEKIGLPAQNGGDTNQPKETPAPDPSDTDKYPLGHLDDRYIEDKLDWLAEKKAAERADAVLQRQQEAEQVQAQQRQYEDLLGKVDDLATRGTELFDDFDETVVKSGMRGDWALTQTTFEAAHEVDHGAEILYELSQDKKEARRVASLSPIQQLRYVEERNREIASAKGGRKVPKAAPPPTNLPRGANSRTAPNPATDNLDDFEKAWAADAKRTR